MKGLQDLITAAGGIVSYLILLAAGVALLLFFWGLAKFIFRLGGDEKAVEEGRNLMIWGIVALFVMVSTWGIINYLQRDLNLNSVRLQPGGGSSVTPAPQAPSSPPDSSLPVCAPWPQISQTGRPCL